MKNLLCMFFILYSFILLGWDSPSKVSNTSKESILPSIALNKGGNIIVAWEEIVSGQNSEVYLSRKQSAGWSSPMNLSNSGIHSKMPFLAYSKTSNAYYLIWYEESSMVHSDVYFRRSSNGTSWSGRSNLSGNPRNCSEFPSFMVSNDGFAHVVWGELLSGSFDVMYRGYNGNNWGGMQNATKTNQHSDIRPSVYATSSTHVYLVYMRLIKPAGIWSLYYSSKSGSKWSSPQEITRNLTPVLPNVAVNNSGDIYLFWTVRGSVKVFYSYKKVGTSFTSPKSITSGMTDMSRITSIVDNSGGIHLFAGSPRGLYHFIFSSGTYVGSGKITDMPSKDPHTAYDKENNTAHITWQNTSNNEIYYTKGIISDVTQPSENPVAIFSISPKQGRHPLKVSFDASASYDPDGEIVNYNWDFGDDTTGEGEKTTHTYSTKGVYTVTLIVTDNEGLDGVSKDKVYVSDPPVAKFEMNRSRGVAPLTVNFDASKSYDPDGTIRRYSWNFGDNCYGTGKTISHTYAESGNYTVFLTVYDNYSLSATTQHKIEVYVVHSPINIYVESKLNRNLFSKEYINIVKWSPNKFNADHGIEIVQYQIHRRKKGQTTFEYRSSVTSDIFTFWDRGLDESKKDSYSYAIIAIDSEGHNSSLYSASISSAERLLFKKHMDVD